ncbi:MAG: zf-HC2 domain-containing protein [Firmicutes bacterium]|nr:zf-HC2 domain-containing protein [Bacillota bacterium]
MICEECKKKMSEYVDGLLNDVDLQEYEGHLHICSHCRHEVEITRAAVLWLQQAEDVTPPPTLRASVLTALQTEKKIRRSRFFPGFTHAVAAAAVFILLVAGNLLPLSYQARYGRQMVGSSNDAITFESKTDSPTLDNSEGLKPPSENVQPRGDLGSNGREDITVDSKQQSETVSEELDGVAKDPVKPKLPAFLHLFGTQRILLNLILLPIFIFLTRVAVLKRREVLP